MYRVKDDVNAHRCTPRHKPDLGGSEKTPRKERNLVPPKPIAHIREWKNTAIVRTPARRFFASEMTV
jgi:hypothetical protein